MHSFGIDINVHKSSICMHRNKTQGKGCCTWKPSQRTMLYPEYVDSAVQEISRSSHVLAVQETRGLCCARNFRAAVLAKPRITSIADLGIQVIYCI